MDKWNEMGRIISEALAGSRQRPEDDDLAADVSLPPAPASGDGSPEGGPPPGGATARPSSPPGMDDRTSTPMIPFDPSNFVYGSPDSSMAMNRSVEIDDVLDLLDSVERQVESFRKKCEDLEAEKQSLLQTLSTVAALSNDASSLNHVDRMDCVAAAARLKGRLDAVKLEIVVVRDVHQTQALSEVLQMVDSLIDQVQKGGDKKRILDTARLYRHACVNGGTGSKFESLLVSCTSHDQKDLKQRVVDQVNLIEASLSHDE